jgi:hypothetical protein
MMGIWLGAGCRLLPTHEDWSYAPFCLARESPMSLSHNKLEIIPDAEMGREAVCIQRNLAWQN